MFRLHDFSIFAMVLFIYFVLTYNDGKHIVEKVTKLSKIGFSIERFTGN